MAQRKSVASRIACSMAAATLAVGLVPAAALADNGEQESALDKIEQNDCISYGSSIYNYEEGDSGAETLAAALPRSFDLRGRGVVTPVKFQNPWGTCWGFSAIAAAETSILSELGTTYDETGLDLSELHLAWFAATALPDNCEQYPSQSGEGYHYNASEGENESSKLNVGGFSATATSVLSSGIGPEYEEIVPYHGVNPETGESTVVSRPDGTEFYYSPDDDWSIDEDERFWTAFELEESNILPSPANVLQQMDENGNITSTYLGYNEDGTFAIKNELMNGRAVSINYYADQSMPNQQIDPDQHVYINTDTWAQYTYEYVEPDHAVTIVGWDDDYPKENFNEDHQPEYDGAWLVKNSWGAADQEFPNKNSWGVDGSGYFWLSYYDQTIQNPETLDFDVDGSDSQADYLLVDQYDFLPNYGTTVYSSTSDETRMANVFTASEDMLLRAVSAETTAPNSSVDYEIYLLDENASDPTDGTLAASVSEKYDFGGYHRATFDDPIEVPAGQKYSVIVTVTTPSGLYQFKADAGANEKSGSAFYAKGVVNEGESYLYSEGGWHDWANLVAQEKSSNPMLEVDNFPIKAYADPSPIEFPDVSESDWYYDAVQYVAFRDIMTGYTGGDLDGYFGPANPMERQDAAVMLYKYLAPEEYAATSDPTVYASIEDNTGMPDVLDGQYYTPAVNWAYENGYITGYSAGANAGTFGVGNPITREEFSTIAYRAKALGEGEGSALDTFPDSANVSEYAREAMAAMVQAGVVQGNNGLLLPQSNINRAEVATMMMRIDLL